MRRSDLGAAAAGAAVGGVVFLLTHQALGDDAHITMAYARNLALRGEWGLIPGETANSATSPLNVWLIALGTFLTRQPAVGVGLVLMASLTAAGWWSAQLARLLGLSRVLPFAAVTLLGTSPLLVSTVGLETYLGVGLLIGMVRYSAEGRWLPAGVVGGLLVLTRPDYVVFAAVVALVLLPRRLPATAGVAIVVAAPWHVASWLLLGSAVPDTFVFKTAEHDWHGATLATPLTYLGVFPTATLALAVLPAAAGVLCAAGWGATWLRGAQHPARRVALAFASAGVAHWAALSALEVPPYLWYYGPVVAGLTLCAAVTAATWRPAAVGGSAVVAGACAVLLLAPPIPWREPPLLGNYATAAEGATVGRAVARIVPDGAAVASPGEIGTLAFFCDCRILDKFSHRGLAVRIIEQRMADAGPMIRRLLQWNYLHLPPIEQVPRPEWRLVFRTDPTARTPRDVRWWPATASWHEPGQVVLVRRPESVG